MLKRDPITGAISTDLVEQRIESAGGYTYIGIAEPGSSDSEPVWIIQRVGSTGNIRFANKKATESNIWESSPGNADYAGYTYV